MSVNKQGGGFLGERRMDEDKSFIVSGIGLTWILFGGALFLANQEYKSITNVICYAMIIIGLLTYTFSLRGEKE